MYKPQSDPRFKSALQEHSRSEHARQNDPARKRAEEQARLIRLLSAVAPAAGALGGTALGAGIGAFGGPKGAVAGSMIGGSVGGAAGSAVGQAGQAYDEYSMGKYTEKDNEVAAREQQMMALIGALR